SGALERLPEGRSIGRACGWLWRVLEDFEPQAFRAEVEWEFARLGDAPCPSPVIGGEVGGSTAPEADANADWLHRALLLVATHPDWSTQQYAGALRISRATFYRRAKSEPVLWAALQARKAALSNLPAGHIGDGGVEATNPEDE